MKVLTRCEYGVVFNFHRTPQETRARTAEDEAWGGYTAVGADRQDVRVEARLVYVIGC